MTRIEAIVSDFGGVLTSPLVDSFVGVLGSSGVTFEELGKAMAALADRRGSNPLFELETGRLSEPQFMDAVAEELSAHRGSRVDLDSFGERYFGHLKPNERLIDYMRGPRRLRVDAETGQPRFTRHGSLVMDWVEVFAPVVFEAHRPRQWPASGSLLLDDLPFSVRDPDSGRHRIAFRVFAAMGYDSGRPRLWRLEAFTTKSQPDWEAFLGALDGAPPRVVCDNDDGLRKAVRARFPDAELYLCEWHLRHALERLMGKLRASSLSTGTRSKSCWRYASAGTGSPSAPTTCGNGRRAGAPCFRSRTSSRWWSTRRSWAAASPNPGSMRSRSSAWAPRPMRPCSSTT